MTLYDGLVILTIDGRWCIDSPFDGSHSRDELLAYDFAVALGRPTTKLLVSDIHVGVVHQLLITHWETTAFSRRLEFKTVFSIKWSTSRVWLRLHIYSDDVESTESVIVKRATVNTGKLVAELLNKTPTRLKQLGRLDDALQRYVETVFTRYMVSEC